MYSTEETLQEALAHPDEVIRLRGVACRDQIAALEVDLDRSAAVRQRDEERRQAYATVGLG